METNRTALLVAAALTLLAAPLAAQADVVSGSYTLYSGANQISTGGSTTVSTYTQSFNLSALEASLPGFNGFSSLTVQYGLYGNNSGVLTSDTYSGYSRTGTQYSADGSVEYLTFTNNENLNYNYGVSGASATVGTSSAPIADAPVFSSTAQNLGVQTSAEFSCGTGCALYAGSLYTDVGNSPFNFNNLCNVGDCYAHTQKNQYFTNAGYVGEYSNSVALGVYDLAGVNATNAISSTLTLYGSNVLHAETLDYTYAPVPLPAAVWLLVSGLGGLGIFARKKKFAA